MTIEGVGEPIRVLLVDDHGVVRRGLRAYLQVFDDIEVVGEASDGGEAVAVVASLAATGAAPDVVLMDLAMSPVDGVEATRRIRTEWPEVEVVAVTSFVEETRVMAALEAGASGYIIKDAAAEEIVVAIRAANRGEVVVDPQVTRALMAALRARSRTDAVRPADRPRARGPGAGRAGAQQPPDRARAGDQRADRPDARQQHPAQAGLASRTQAALYATRHGMPGLPGQGSWDESRG